MPELVTKTVVFADVVDSTSLFESLGDQRARAVIREVMERLTEITEGARGDVVKELGDGIISIFPEAGDAVDFATKAHRYSKESSETPELAIGVMEGDVLEEGGDIFGDAVNVAARLSDLASAGQIITTEPTLESVLYQVRKRPLGPRQVKGRREPLQVVEILWEEEQASNLTSFRLNPQAAAELRKVLRLNFQGEKAELDTTGSEYHLTLGRSPDNQFQVGNPEASRRHATIEIRNRNFYLIDHSTNGTYVESKDAVVTVRREAFLLHGKGTIGLGVDPTGDGVAPIEYEILEGSEVDQESDMAPSSGHTGAEG